MSDNTKATKRRDQSPVRVYADGRVAYWTGGKPGVGKRLFDRCGNVAAAEIRAAELLERLVKAHGMGPQAGVDLDQAMRDMLIGMREAGDEEGSIRQYRSNWNAWVPKPIGAVRCLDVDIRQWSAIFDQANNKKASETTIRNIARTLGVFTEWAVDHGYFASSEPFGDPRRRRAIVKKARKRARIVKAETKKRFKLSTCPTVKDVEKYAAAFEEVYPGYGWRLVILAFATGLRINEVLALRHDSINIETGEVAVDWQLNRYEPWPAQEHLRRPTLAPSSRHGPRCRERGLVCVPAFTSRTDEGAAVTDGVVDAHASSRSSQAYEELRELLLGGTLGPGTRLTEAELTKTLEVSRNTIRAILVRLVQEGYLTSEPNRGVRTRWFSIEEALGVMEAREALESALAEKAAERATDEELDTLAAICDAMSDAAYVESEEQYAHLNRRFHQQIRDSARQPILAGFADSLVYPLVMRQYRDLTHTSPRQTTLVEHRAIVSALQTRNGDAAAAAMRHHIALGRAALLEHAERERAGQTVGETQGEPESDVVDLEAP